MEKYFCIFSDLGTIRKDFYFKTKEDYMSFLLSNKKEIIWAKLIEQDSGVIIDEYQNMHYIDFSNINFGVPEGLREKCNSFLLINQQQLVWMVNFASVNSPNAFAYMNKNPILAYNIPSTSQMYEKSYVPSGLSIVDQETFFTFIKLIKKECVTKYKERLFKLMVDTKGFEISFKKKELITYNK